MALVCALVPAGCGGGGGGTTGVSVPPITPVSVATTPPIQTATVQRSLVQQALTATSESSTIAQDGSSSTSSTLSVMRRTLSEGRARESTSTCVNGVTSTTTAGSTSNVEYITVSDYYDTACTELWFTGQLTVTVTSSTLATATGSYTYYTKAGAEYEYAGPVTLTLSLASPAYFSLLTSLATSAGASPYMSVGVGCSIASGTDSCSVASADHLAALSLDDAAVANVSATLQSGTSGETIALSGSGSAYTGALNSTSVVNQGTYLFGITGGSVIDTASMAGSFNFTSAGLVSGGSIQLTDAADGATVTAAYNTATQTIGGSVTQTSTNTVVATYSVSVIGTGTITYGNGTTGTITGWVIQS
jgi:hypothetical protein